MMRAFSGRTHLLITALIVKGKLVQEIIETTELEVDTLSEEVINSIADSPSEWENHAGGYTIDAKYGATIFKKINGDYYNVIGLPICSLSHLLYNEHLEYEKDLNKD